MPESLTGRAIVIAGDFTDSAALDSTAGSGVALSMIDKSIIDKSMIGKWRRQDWTVGLAGPLLLLFICVGLQLLQARYPDVFLYDRTAIAGGEYWRLLSGQLVHTNAAHLLMNGAAVIALWLVFGQSRLLGERHPVAAYLGLVALLSVLISAGLWIWFPEVTDYYGLSGVLHGLFCFGAMSDLSARRWSGAVLLIGCFGKVAWEWTVGPSAATADLIEAEVAISSHFLGTLWGSVLGLLLWGKRCLFLGETEK